ncbi:Protein of unknown function [Hydrobacter penzbergensis]|uniref:DUF2911 domain-containing protein n=1 Tax=Hydrobacter penzbergensis TaxID=1235997 RepID=A0A8X8IID0_9BACT|nr:DUF2911 domain-containing protein [Hydrobacter penzbergensis]SDX47421.1 Protein of unknown function [Hydrobacter penzbergensis]
MRSIVLGCLLIVCSFASQAQQKPTELDKSPMDMSYWPDNYPILRMSGKAKDQPVARLIYSRPLKSGRDIFGGIIKYNELWRLGANESTELELFKNVRIGGKLLPAGRYTMYCIPGENKWTIIINRDNYCWGSFTYDSRKDVLRTDIEVGRNNEVVEAFTMYFDDARNGANLIILWDNLKAVMPITLNGDNPQPSKKNTPKKN